MGTRHRGSFDRSHLALLMLLPWLWLVAGGTPARIPASAQEQIPSLRAQRIRFIDSATGYAVIPREISVREARSQRLVYRKQVVEEPGAAEPEMQRGILRLSLSYGTYEYVVKASGYRPSAAAFTVGAASPQQIDFYLDPLETPPELEPQKLAGLRCPEATLIVGFVVNDETGRPLANVRVAQVGGTVIAETNQRGFFLLLIPLPPQDEGIPTTELLFEKKGYQGEERRFVELVPNGDLIYRIRLAPGTGRKVIDERHYRRRGQEQSLATQPASEGVPQPSMESTRTPAEEQISSPPAAPVVVPSTMRVGRNCSCTACSALEVYSLETYGKYVLPAEWFPCWGGLAGGTNSLRAGAVAIRSYASYYQRNPLSSSYDICDNTCCQVFGSSQTSNTNAAVDETLGFVLAEFDGAIARTEYSSENNNTGCGDCATLSCLFDPVCCGATANGHGRGMCQYGSVRWATGTRITTTSPCASGTGQAYATKDWQAILAHYYPALSLTQGFPLQGRDRVLAAENLDVRKNPGTGCGAVLCANDPACPTCILCVAQVGNTGEVVGGPAQVEGQTWWQILWDPGSGNCPDGTVGWTTEKTLLRLTPGVVLALNASTVFVTATAGEGNPRDRGVSVEEANHRGESWSASTDVAWVTASPAAGTTPALIRLAANTAGLATGVHTGTLTVQSPTGAFTPISARIELVLNARPVGNTERAVEVSQNRVDGFDLARLARAFGSRPGDPHWDPAVNLVDVDRNNNGVIDPGEIVIDTSDLAELARNFGKSG